MLVGQSGSKILANPPHKNWSRYVAQVIQAQLIAAAAANRIFPMVGELINQARVGIQGNSPRTGATQSGAIGPANSFTGQAPSSLWNDLRNIQADEAGIPREGEVSFGPTTEPDTQSARAQPHLSTPQEYDSRIGNPRVSTGDPTVDAAVNGGPLIETVHGPTPFSRPNSDVTVMPPKRGVVARTGTAFSQHFEARVEPLPPVDTRTAPAIPVQLGPSVDWPQAKAASRPPVGTGRWGRGVDSMSSAAPLPGSRERVCGACAHPTTQPVCAQCDTTYCTPCESMGHHAMSYCPSEP